MAKLNAINFLEALRQGSLYTSNKISFPVLKCALITKAEELTIASSDLKHWRETTVYAAGEDRWSIAMPRQLIEWLAVWKFKDDDVVTLNFLPRQNTLEVFYGRNRASIVGFDAGEFPIRPDPSEIDWQIPQQKVKRTRAEIQHGKSVKSLGQALLKANDYCNKTAVDAKESNATFLWAKKGWEELPNKIAEDEKELVSYQTNAFATNEALTKPLENYAKKRRGWHRIEQYQDKKAQAAHHASKALENAEVRLADLKATLKAGKKAYIGETQNDAIVASKEAINAANNLREASKLYAAVIGLPADTLLKEIIKHAWERRPTK